MADNRTCYCPKCDEWWEPDVWDFENMPYLVCLKCGFDRCTFHPEKESPDETGLN